MDQLESYGTSTREILPGLKHRQYRSLNNRAENAHLPPPAVPDATAPGPRVSSGDDAIMPELVGVHGHDPGRVGDQGGVVLPPVYRVIASGTISTGIAIRLFACSEGCEPRLHGRLV